MIGLDASAAERALADLCGLGIERYEHEALTPRIWALRNVLSAYDAA